MRPGKHNENRVHTISLTAVTVLGILIGAVGSQVLAAMKGPTEHKGISVTALGQIEDESMMAQIGLKGYILRLRSATIEPGGHIKEHNHATRPGVVKVISGTWIEGRPDGEYEYNASEDTGLLEHKDTVHWIYNRGNVPATAIICDIAPSS